MSTKTKKTEPEFNFRSIKSFEDACTKEGIDPLALPDVSMIPETFRKPIISCYKLYIIYQAINNRWVADWNNYNQLKYFPWFSVNSSGSGFDFSNSDYHYTHALALVGSRLCTDTAEKAIYIGKQFGEEYAELFLIRD